MPRRFKDKPISLTVALNLELIPLSVIFSGFVKAVDSTIFEMDFFKFSMDPIKKNIFTLTTKSKDTSPPVFETPCSVYQDDGHDPTSPGIQLTYSANDPDTKVETAFWSVGTTLGGQDVKPEAALDVTLKTSFQPLLKVASGSKVGMDIQLHREMTRIVPSFSIPMHNC